MKQTLYIVTGAPGAGKSTTVEAFTKLSHNYLVFDIDWLTQTASHLVGKDIYTTPSTWQPYNSLWMCVLSMIVKNGKTPLLFAPFDKTDMEQNPPPKWYNSIEWLLLDCPDSLRRERLIQRPGWTKAKITSAIADAVILRQTIPLHLNTGSLPPTEIAQQVLNWLEKLNQ